MNCIVFVSRLHKLTFQLAGIKKKRLLLSPRPLTKLLHKKRRGFPSKILVSSLQFQSLLAGYEYELLESRAM